MILICLQSTVDYMFTVNPDLVKELEAIGKPEIKEIMGSNGDNIRYYKWDDIKEKTRGK